MNIHFNNKSLLIAIALFAVGCNDAPSTNDGSTMMMDDGSVPMMDGMVMMDVDAGVDSGSTVVDAGYDSGSTTNVNQCLTNNGGCFAGVLCTDHSDPTPVTCGSCPAGYTGNGKVCTLVSTWLCAMNEVYKEDPSINPDPCSIGVAYTGGSTDAATALGPYYYATVTNSDMVAGSIYWYRICIVTSTNAPVMHTSTVSGRSSRLDDCVLAP